MVEGLKSDKQNCIPKTVITSAVKSYRFNGFKPNSVMRFLSRKHKRPKSKDYNSLQLTRIDIFFFTTIIGDPHDLSLHYARPTENQLPSFQESNSFILLSSYRLSALLHNNFIADVFIMKSSDGKNLANIKVIFNDKTLVDGEYFFKRIFIRNK